MKKFLLISMCLVHGMIQPMQRSQLNPEEQGLLYQHLQPQAVQFNSESLPLHTQRNIHVDPTFVTAPRHVSRGENVFIEGHHATYIHKVMALGIVCMLLSAAGFCFVVMPAVNMIKG